MIEEKSELKQKDRSSLLLRIASKKSLYEKARRPLFWYGSVMGFLLLIVIVGIILVSTSGDNAYIGGWSIFAIIAGCFILLILLINFFIGIGGFGGPTRIKHLLSIKEEIEYIQLQLRLLDEYEAQQRSPRESYREELSRSILKYQKQANRYRNIHYSFQFFIILLSLLVASLTSGLTGLFNFDGKLWLTPALSLLVTFLTAMVTLFRPHDRGFNLQQTADAIEYELKTAQLRIFDYDGLSDEEALKRLSERGERLTDEQRKRQLQLEQASHTKHAPE